MRVDLDEILEIAIKTADKSPCRFKVACVLVDNRGRVVATGFNRYSHNGKKMGKNTVHAEVEAISKVRKPSNNLTAFIYRKNGRDIDPCESCSIVLKAYGINKVYCVHDRTWMKSTDKTEEG